MPLPWPSFWEHIRAEDRSALSDVLTQLLAHGVLLGDSGRDRQLYLLAREYQHEMAEYFAPLHLELVSDPDHPIYQLRPVPSDCGLIGRFGKAETLLVLTLWRMYHDVRMEKTLSSVMVSTNEIWSRLKLYFEQIEPPTESHLREMLQKLKYRRLIRIQSSEENQAYGETLIEILPTLARVIPFENTEAWEQQRNLYDPVTADSASAESE